MQLYIRIALKVSWMGQTAKQVASFSISTKLVDCEELVQGGLSGHFRLATMSLLTGSGSAANKVELARWSKRWGHLLFNSHS